jgi:hypothetical protein
MASGFTSISLTFDRDSTWREGDAEVAATRSGDGSPSAVRHGRRQMNDGRVIVRDANEADDRFYDLEFSTPVLSPDGRYLAVLQISELAPAPILLAFDLTGQGPIWKAASQFATPDDRRYATYRWTADGRLVVLHQAGSSSEPVLTVFDVQP